jgi:hypothetical protein
MQKRLYEYSSVPIYPATGDCQFSIQTSGLMSSDRIRSPFGMSFSSALLAAASDDVSIPAER